MTFMICLFACISVFGQTPDEPVAEISADIASIIMSRNLRLGFSHSLDGRWSVDGGISIKIPALPARNDEEKEHDMTLDIPEEKDEPITSAPDPELKMGIRFWTKRFLEGGYLGVSCSYGLASGADMSVCAGYAARIWKRLGLYAGYEAKVMRSARQGKFAADGITIGINYSF